MHKKCNFQKETNYIPFRKKKLLKTLKTKTILSTRKKDYLEGVDQQVVSDAVFIMSFIRHRTRVFILQNDYLADRRD